MRGNRSAGLALALPSSNVFTAPDVDALARSAAPRRARVTAAVAPAPPRFAPVSGKREAPRARGEPPLRLSLDVRVRKSLLREVLPRVPRLAPHAPDQPGTGAPPVPRALLRDPRADGARGSPDRHRVRGREGHLSRRRRVRLLPLLPRMAEDDGRGLRLDAPDVLLHLERVPTHSARRGAQHLRVRSRAPLPSRGEVLAAPPHDRARSVQQGDGRVPHPVLLSRGARTKRESRRPSARGPPRSESRSGSSMSAFASRSG